MKLNFRQGIVRHQSDVSGNPTFLQRSSGTGQYVDLIVSPEPCVLTFAHRDANYIVEEIKTVPNAWGPIIASGTRYLFWDVNLLTGALSRGMTTLPPVYSSSSPVSPAIDQYWFDTNENISRVYTVQGWSERVRLFAGHVTSGAIIRPSKIGSQAGLVGDCEGGHIVLDSFRKPLRESNGSFVTSITRLNTVNLGTVTSRLESTITNIMSLEEIPKLHLVQLRVGGGAVLARSTDYKSRVSGIIVEDLYEGDVGRLITTGLVRDQTWAFPPDKVNKPLFCGAAGEVTLSAPQQGVLQIVGFVYDVDSVFINVHQPLVIDSPEDIIPPPPPPPATNPIANFTATPTAGVAPLTVTFTATGVYGTTYEWDFTNDGFVDGTGSVITYTFATPGTYTVRHRAINSFGFDDEVKVSHIVVQQPNQVPVQTNLGLIFGAPQQVTGGQIFSFQVIVTNDGLANATNVQREIKLRANNNSQITMTSVPAGAVVSYAGNKTTITLPQVNINSGANVSVTMQAQPNTNVTSMQIQGSVSSPQTDSAPGDNDATVTIAVRP